MKGLKTDVADKLAAGQPARTFSVTDIEGNPITLDQYSGRWLLLSFYRYASCPLCNLRVHELINQHASLRSGGLNLVGFFQSPAGSIRKHVGRQQIPFPIIADPEQVTYRSYGVEPSWVGLGRVALKMPRAIEAVFGKRFLPGKIDGDLAMVPADFLIAPDLTVRCAYYGRDIADHMPMSEIRNLMRA